MQKPSIHVRRGALLCALINVEILIIPFSPIKCAFVAQDSILVFVTANFENWAGLRNEIQHNVNIVGFHCFNPPY
jgi:hypothetical protein